MNKSLKYSLIGAAVGAASLASFSAWGAESVYTLIANGEHVIAQMNQAKAQRQQLEQKSKNLAAMAQSIKEAQQQLNQAISQLNAANKQLQSAIDAYNKTCQSKSLTPSEVNQCKAKRKELQVQKDQLNAKTPELQAQQKTLQDKITKYNAGSGALNAAIPSNTGAINNAFEAEQKWLDNARNLVAAPAFAPYRKAAGCPEVKNPPKTASAMQHMAGELLHCLRNLAHHHSKHKAPSSSTKR